VTVKKAAIIIMLCIYTLVSLGVQLHLHYCCGQFSDFHFFAVEHCNYEMGEEEDHCCKKENCCSFIHIDIKLDDSHQPSETSRIVPIEIEDSFGFCLQAKSTLYSNTVFISQSDSPPPISRRYVLYRSLVLYA